MCSDDFITNSFSIGLRSDAYELISFKLGTVADSGILYILVLI